MDFKNPFGIIILTNFNHFQRQIKLYVHIWTNQTIQRNG